MAASTDFAPAERESDEKVDLQSEIVGQELNFSSVWQKLPIGSVILNKNRQIVSVNDYFLKITTPDSGGVVLGKRLGEAVGCTRVENSPGGCGTTIFCSTCGAGNSILKAGRGEENENECAILLKDLNVLELSVRSFPINVGGEDFIAFSVKDISDEKRRNILERIFFHDINNTLSCLSLYSEQLNETGLHELEYKDKIAGKIGSLVSRLNDEIVEQSILLSAERGELEIRKKRVQSYKLVGEIVAQYNYNGISGAERIKLRQDFYDLGFSSDSTLLSRVLGNMIKNGLEASDRYSEVTVGCRLSEDQVVFSVHNTGVIPEEVALQVFKRSFSTKGVGRGVGTYSMKFISQNYLNGDVYFESSPDCGTIFYAAYPVD